jgi:capsular exopolysaccharide synthesis family protein
VRSDYDAARAAEQALIRTVGELKGDSLAEQDRSVQYNLLAREADTNRTIYDGLLQRYKELNASAGISASNISIIDLADVPTGPSSPSLPKFVAFALLAGLAAAAGIVFLRDQIDDTVKVPEDVEQKLGVTLLGVVPEIADADPGTALADPKSPASEAYSSLRSTLLYSTPNGLPRSMMVTSSQPAEGKSTTSAALARRFAMMGKRVVLIDLDLRRPSLHKSFGVENKRGMSDLLTSSDPLAAHQFAAVEPNLTLIPSGPIPPSPTELLSTSRFSKLLDEMEDQFDVVVIDSPPVLGLADAPLISALVDGVVMVVEANGARRGSTRSALGRLRMMNSTILGAVLTKFRPEAGTNRYSAYYGAQYYHYKDSETAPAAY